MKRKAYIKRSPLPKRKSPIRRKAKVKGTLSQRRSNPYSSYWEEKASELWPLIVKERVGWHCEKCGRKLSRDKMNAHHLISVERKMLKHVLENGICLCAGCHKFNRGAPHSGVDEWIFTDWLQKEFPERWEWMLRNKHMMGRTNFKEAYDRLMDVAIDIGLMGEVVT